MVWRDTPQMVAAAPGPPASRTAAATRLGWLILVLLTVVRRSCFWHVSTLRRRLGQVQYGKIAAADRTVCYERQTLLHNHGRCKTMKCRPVMRIMRYF